MRKIYFLFLFVLIASMSGLQAETVTWNITGRTSGSGPATEIVVRTDNSSSGVWTATADTEFSSGTGSGSKYIQLGSKNDPCVDVNIALSESVIPSNANLLLQLTQKLADKYSARNLFLAQQRKNFLLMDQLQVTFL